MDNISENLMFDDNIPMYSIGVVADLLNVSVHTLRLYENEGLLLPFKKDSKHRLYTKNDIIRLQCIREAITEKKFSIQSIKAMMALIPCWTIKKCSKKERERCPAYSGYLQPCWTYKHDNNICALQSCNQCEVYTNHAHCEKIKKTIKEKTE